MYDHITQIGLLTITLSIFLFSYILSEIGTVVRKYITKLDKIAAVRKAFAK